MIFRWLAYTLAIFFTCWILPGISVEGFWLAVMAAAMMGIINFFIRPFVLILTFPITILTFGLFRFVINALMLLLASAIIDGFKVEGFWWALLGSLIISTVYEFIVELGRE